MEEYAKAKAQQLADNARLIEAVSLMGVEATYFAGQFTIKDVDGNFLGKMTAGEWLAHFSDALEQIKQERK